MDTDPETLVSFSRGMTNADGVVNSNEAKTVGMEMQKLLDGGCFTDKLSLKLKCKNFNVLRKRLNVNKKKVLLEPYKLFNRLAIVS